MMDLEIEHAQTPTDEVCALIGELETELSGSYAPEQRHGLNIAQVFRPGILFFMARLKGEPVGCGGVAIENEFAEVKRMYVRPHARGRQVAGAILARLEKEAALCGVTRMTLETGDAQHAAIRFYERAGFSRCVAFGAYAAMSPRQIERSVFFEKQIA